MDVEFEKVCKEDGVTWLRYCPGICLQAMSKISKHLNQDNQFPSRVSNPEPPKSQSYTSLLSPILLHSSTNNIEKERRLQSSSGDSSPIQIH
jgi:hypothetical protein